MSLTEHGRACGTDKVTDHSYTEHYERHLQHLRDDRFTLLEIGIGGYFDPGEGGESLRMWRRYFQKAHIVGLDIVDKRFLTRPRMSIYVGDQTDAAVLTRIFDEHGPIRVVIDDGSHRPADIRETFRIIFPLLEDGGMYVIEDVQTSYWPTWGGSVDRDDPGTTMALVKDLLDGLNWMEFLDAGYEPSYTDLNVRAVHAYHNLVFIQKGSNNEPTQRDRIAEDSE
jgi:demethylmacrocin O-methyltransferase